MASLINQCLIEQDNLIYGNQPTADVFTVKIRAAKGTKTDLKRGTVLALSTGSGADGKYVPLGTEIVGSETLDANCILAEDVTVTTDKDVVTTAYRTGHFNKNALYTVNDRAVEAKDKEALRDVGILLSDTIG